MTPFHRHVGKVVDGRAKPGHDRGKRGNDKDKLD
jgi:hypothetical protein